MNISTKVALILMAMVSFNASADYAWESSTDVVESPDKYVWEEPTASDESTTNEVKTEDDNLETIWIVGYSQYSDDDSEVVGGYIGGYFIPSDSLFGGLAKFGYLQSTENSELLKTTTSILDIQVGTVLNVTEWVRPYITAGYYIELETDTTCNKSYGTVYNCNTKDPDVSNGDLTYGYGILFGTGIGIYIDTSVTYMRYFNKDAAIYNVGIGANF